MAERSVQGRGSVRRVGDPGGGDVADGFVVVVDGCPESGEFVDVEWGWGDKGEVDIVKVVTK